MVTILIKFLDTDDCQGKSCIIPCDNLETAQAIAKKLYNEYVTYRMDGNSNGIEWYDNGGWWHNEGEYGYLKVEIIEEEPITEKDVNDFRFDWGKVQLSWSPWWKEIK